MKNKKKAIIITAIGLVLLLAVIVTAVVMKQSIYLKVFRKVVKSKREWR